MHHQRCGAGYCSAAGVKSWQRWIPAGTDEVNKSQTVPKIFYMEQLSGFYSALSESSYRLLYLWASSSLTSGIWTNENQSRLYQSCLADIIFLHLCLFSSCCLWCGWSISGAAYMLSTVEVLLYFRVSFCFTSLCRWRDFSLWFRVSLIFGSVKMNFFDFSAHVVSASKSSFMFQPFRTNGHNPGVQQWCSVVPYSTTCVTTSSWNSKLSSHRVQCSYDLRHS